MRTDPTPPTPPPNPQPWIDFLLYPKSNIGSTPTLIFSSPHICIVQSIKIVNMVDQPIEIYMYLLRSIEGSSQQIFLSNGFTIEPLGSKNFLENDVMNIQPTDTLYAYSDFSSKKFNSFISYSALIQPEEPIYNVR
jgi:hypothetical protein